MFEAILSGGGDETAFKKLSLITMETGPLKAERAFLQ